MLEVLTPRDEGFTQPDVHFESENERVFIELKVNARVELEQVQKYALLHAKYAEKDHSQKLPLLLFVTKRDFAKHWKPRREFVGVAADQAGAVLGRRLSEEPFSQKLSSRKAVRRLESYYRPLLRSLRLGFTTWQELGDSLVEQTAHPECCQVASMFISGFLGDLRRRELWAGSESA